VSELANRVQALEEGLSSASRVRLSVAQLGAVVAAIACATWWASSHMASKDDVKSLEEKVTAAGATLKEVATTVAVLKDRSDRFEIPMLAEAVAPIESRAAANITRAARAAAQAAPAAPAATATAAAAASTDR